jgi:hypothetical protein
MDVAGELQQVGVVLADDGFVAVLKEMPVAGMAAIEVDYITGEELAHAGGERLLDCPHQEMEMVGQERPSVDGKISPLAEIREAAQEVLPVAIVLEDPGPFDPSADYMMQGSRGIEARLTGHGERIKGKEGVVKKVVFAPTSPLPFQIGY